ncbi:TetR/AcrR family transcriptional regulator [Streptomyces sp. LN500]|uniref:TetR/AcrR family transcriptional regulator n=2 Tax=unclassified Streptomyces TaxID=2593676 RepID=UPI0037244A7D
MATLREDETLHVVGGKLHRFADRGAQVLRSADRQDGEGQPSSLALLVLRDGRIECAVELEAGSQGFRIGSEGVDVALGSATGLGCGSLYGAFGNKDALFGQCLDRYASIYGAQYEQALAAHPGDPVRAVEAFFDVILGRIADPSVPVGCLIAQSAAQTNPREPRTPTHRVRAISMRAERLQPAEHAVHQLALDSRDGKAHDLEAALDRDWYGPATDGNATTYRTVAASADPPSNKGSCPYRCVTSISRRRSIRSSMRGTGPSSVRVSREARMP